MYQNTYFLGTSLPLLSRFLHIYVGIGELEKELRAGQRLPRIHTLLHVIFYKIRSPIEAVMLPSLKASYPDLRSGPEEEGKEPRDVKCAPFRL